MKKSLSFLTILAFITGAQAQVNYSANVVGFYNLHVLANQPLLIANQLDTGNNTLNQLLTGGPPGAVLSKYDNGLATATFDGTTWDTNMTLNPGEGGLYTSPEDTTLMFCGTVLQGSLTNTLPIGAQVIRSDMVPLPGRGPLAFGIPSESNDTLSLYAGEYVTYTNGITFPNDPLIGVGQAFWYGKAVTALNDLWIQSYAIAPVAGGANLAIAPAGAGQFTLTLSGASSSATYYIMSKRALTNIFWHYEAAIVGNSTTTIYANERGSAFFRAICSTADTDKDGLPDWWMMEYFGHPTGQAYDKSRAQDDADGDGVSNQQKFIRGANPRYIGSTTLFISSPKQHNLP